MRYNEHIQRKFAISKKRIKVQLKKIQTEGFFTHSEIVKMIFNCTATCFDKTNGYKLPFLTNRQTKWKAMEPVKQ